MPIPPRTVPPEVSSPPARRSRTLIEPPAANDTVRAWLAVVRAYNLCDALLASRLSTLGVRVPEHEILANLRREPGISQQLLAARCFSAKSHISGLLTLLEGRGWVRREVDPADARARRLVLTAEGERIAARTAQVQAEVVATMAGDESSATLEAVQAAMQRVSVRLEAALAP